jgi:hypothetical protein
MSILGLGDGAFDFGNNDSGAFANFGPVILHDGTHIGDPGGTPATQAQCAPYQCGVDRNNAAAIFWCGYWGQEGFGGAKPCMSPDCAPYRSLIPGCNIVQPSPLAPDAPVPVPMFPPPVLTPANIVQPLPDITQANQHVPITTDTSCLCAISSMINNNPLIAVLALVGATALLSRKGRR